MNKVIFLAVSLLANVLLAGTSTLFLSGVVRDSGFVVTDRSLSTVTINNHQNSKLKVYVAQLGGAGRTPQSVNSAASTWTELHGQKSINVSSYIKVVAP